MGATKSISMVTRNVYDGLGNLVSRTEADGQPQAKTTRYVYDAAGRQIRTVYAPVSVYDATADNLLTNGASGVAARKESAPISLTSDVLYDAFGNAVAGRDVAGAVSYKVYDKTGALKYEVDAEGFVTEYERNPQGDDAAPALRHQDLPRQPWLRGHHRGNGGGGGQCRRGRS
ncbi:RHS repeat domain-containing protein [Achromobacter insuavis]